MEKSPTEAAKCYRKLASCYANGLGVEKNPIEADQWRRNAAEQEDAAKATVGAPTSAIPIPVEETPKTRADTPADRTPNPSEETATTGAGVPVIATPKPPSDLRAFVVLLWGLLSGLV